MPIEITPSIQINDDEWSLSAIRAQGAGGQNVNKVSSAIHLRFDVMASSLPDIYKQRLLALSDSRITNDGVIVIKSQQFRTQEKNRIEAVNRLRDLLVSVTVIPKLRRPTKPTVTAKKKRVDEKTLRGKTKNLRKAVSDES